LKKKLEFIKSEFEFIKRKVNFLGTVSKAT